VQADERRRDHSRGSTAWRLAAIMDTHAPCAAQATGLRQVGGAASPPGGRLIEDPEMNVEIGPAGVSAGGAQLEAGKRRGRSGRRDDHGQIMPTFSCANCDAALQGAFCHRCGQKAHVHRSLLHLVEEFLHGLLHFETKAWRTIPLLLFRPGRLTRAYIDGKRMRYVSPLALLLFLIFLMFLVFSVTGNTAAGVDEVPTRSALSASIHEGRGRLGEMEAKLNALAPQDEARADLVEGIAERRAELSQLERLLERIGEQGAGAKAREPEPVDGSNTFTPEELHGHLVQHLPWLAVPHFEKKIAHAFENKELTLYKIKGAAAKFAFLLVPISLPFLWLLFLFRRQYRMFDHAVFSLYSLSAMAILVMVLAILGHVGLQAGVAPLAILAPPAHMFAQLRGTYALSPRGAAWRTIALLLIACCVLTIYALLVVLLSM
jgi:hypothetical protein